MNPLEDIKNNISINSYLTTLGINPSNSNSNLYSAPYRIDTKKSMLVSKNGKRFTDLATGEGGSVIDLHSRCRNISFKEALAELRTRDFGDLAPLPTEDTISTENKSKINIKEIEELTNPILIHYLQNRHIPLAIARQYCKELTYNFDNNPTKNYFGIGTEFSLTTTTCY